MDNASPGCEGAGSRPGRVALVTGGTGRIGTAVVAALAARGYAVAIHANGSLTAAREAAARLAALGTEGLAVAANMRDEGPVRAMVHRVADHFGRIDALVACAAMRRPAPLDDVTADDLRAHFDVHCVGTFVVAQEVGAVMVSQASGGAIVTIGDRDGGRTGRGLLAAFTAAGAVPALTRCLAEELAVRSDRVRVNCLQPGSAADDGDGPRRVAARVVVLLEDCPLSGLCVPLDGDVPGLGAGRLLG